MNEMDYVTGYCPEHDEEVTVQVFYIIQSNARIPSGMKCKYCTMQKCNYVAKNRICPIAGL